MRLFLRLNVDETEFDFGLFEWLL